MACVSSLRPVDFRLGSRFGLQGANSAALSVVPSPALVPAAASYAPTSLKIVHMLRAPLGGLFRHVIDVARGQVERGHRVGLVVDSTTGGATAEAIFAELKPRLALGLLRLPIPRQLDPRDVAALWTISRHIGKFSPDVLHGHGAKGAALARLTPSAPNAIRAFTPHGGSLVYSPGTVAGGFYRTLERMLNSRTDLFLFESTYIADLFRTVIGRPLALVRVVRNGIAESEFEPIAPRPDATDLVCVGELRPVKGIDVLIEAIAILGRSGRNVTATVAGDGPNAQMLRDHAKRLGVDSQVRFIGHCPARKAFAMGRMLAMPSRAESLPYVALEAAAAGLPIIATDVGGVHEIFGPYSGRLIPADDVGALVAAIAAALGDPDDMRQVAQAVRLRVRSEFSLSTMVECNLAAYREAIAAHDQSRDLARLA
jgi:glycosyltransferase involved in cell wall biosynthesis